MPALRWWSLFLVPAGLPVGHVVAYGAALAQGSVPSLVEGHGSVDGLLVLSVPLALMVIARVAIDTSRGARRPLRPGWLAALQVISYIALELVEHAGAGMSVGAALREGTMLWGIVAQLGLALLMNLLACGLRAAVRRLPRRSVRRRAQRMAGRVTAPSWVAPCLAAIPVSSLFERGPPRRSC